MGSGFGDAIGRALAAFILVVIVVAFAFGALAMWVLPLVWVWLKPIIHVMTA